MTRVQPPGAWFRTNGTKCWLDLDALKRGDFKFEDGSEQDQCEGCGGDLIETGTLVRAAPGRGVLGYRDVECVECKTRFEIEREEGEP